MRKPRLAKLSKKAQSQLSTSQPQSAEEYLEEGTNQEESGDRWFGSDITKSLRFYQKAYTNYLNAIKLSPTLIDGYYNASRLLFHVYNSYVKQEGVNVYRLENIPEALTNDETAVVQSLEGIIQAHEKAVSVAQNTQGQVSIDLTYNMAIAYSEIIETEENLSFIELVNIGFKVKSLFEDVCERQITELKSFVRELSDLNAGKIIEYEDPLVLQDYDNKYESVEEAIIPKTVMETILSSYRFIQEIFEAVNTNDEMNLAKQSFMEFISHCDNVSYILIREFGPEVSDKIENIPYLTDLDINELRLAQTYIVGLQLDEFSDLYAFWNSPELPNTAEKNMSAANNTQILIEKYKENAKTLDPDTLWNLLSTLNRYHKTAQDLLNASYQSAKLAKSDNLGNYISQIAALMIERSDIELQRCQLPIQAATDNRDVLFKNCKVFLKNAMNLANTSGGLRETMTEKLVREKRKVEAVLRLCLLENKRTVHELDSILGRDVWVEELPSLVSTGIFTNFGINDLKNINKV